MKHDKKTSQRRKRKYSVILRLFRLIIIAVEKKEVLHILIACL